MSDLANALDFLTSQQVAVLGNGGLDIGNNTGPNSATFAPWVVPPTGFSSFDQAGVVAMPAIGSTATILTFTVPDGYDGVIKRISHNYTGGGFVEGSGDLTWMITLDGRPAKNYNNMLTQFGSTLIPRPTDGIQVYSNQVISYLVTHVNNGALGSQVIATIAGYYFPRQTGE